MACMRTLIPPFLVLVLAMLPLAPLHVAMHESKCVQWQLASYTTVWVVGPFNEPLVEYYAVLADGRGDYQAASILALSTLSGSELASFAPVTCAGTGMYASPAPK
jgi:hypothetical protein